MTWDSEAELERYCCKKAKEAGWLAIKFASPGLRGVPDRIFIKDRVVFVEFKHRFGRLSPAQSRVIAMMRKKGAEVYVCYDYSSFSQALRMPHEGHETSDKG